MPDPTPPRRRPPADSASSAPAGRAVPACQATRVAASGA